MRRVAKALSVVVLVIAAASVAHAQEQVALLASVSDPGGGETLALDPKDIRVAENGQSATGRDDVR